MTFEKKKIHIETLSEYLREIREHARMPFEDVVKKTGIKTQFLKSLEEGSFGALPPNVYVFGFLTKLAELYSIESAILIEQYRKEINIQQQVQLQKGTTKTWAGRYFHKLVITPKYMSLFVGVLFVLVTVVYIIWQVLSINKSPNLEIFQPSDRQMVSGTFVEVAGKTDPGMDVTVNGQDVFVDNQGVFKTQLGVSPGPADLVVSAKNKFDKSVTKTVSIVGQEQATAGTENTKRQVELKLEFLGDAMITFIADGQPAELLSFHKGDIKLLTARQKITLSTTDAGVTKATLNNQLIGLLGRPGEKLDNVPFFAQPASSANPETK